MFLQLCRSEKNEQDVAEVRPAPTEQSQRLIPELKLSHNSNQFGLAFLFGREIADFIPKV